MDRESLISFLEEKVIQYQEPSFIDLDPLQIPYLFNQKEDIEINGSIKTAQQLADLLASSSIDIEELISQYTGDIIAHQIGRSFKQIKNLSLSSDGSIIDNLKDELTTILIAPGRSKIFKGRAS